MRIGTAITGDTMRSSSASTTCATNANAMAGTIHVIPAMVREPATVPLAIEMTTAGAIIIPQTAVNVVNGRGASFRAAIHPESTTFQAITTSATIGAIRAGVVSPRIVRTLTRPKGRWHPEQRGG